MKKLCFALLIIASFGLVGCGSSAAESGDAPKAAPATEGQKTADPMGGASSESPPLPTPVGK